MRILLTLDPWVYLDRNDFGYAGTEADGFATSVANNTFKNEVGGIYQLFILLSIVGIVSTLLIAFAKYGWGTNGWERMMTKQEVVHKTIIALAVFASPGILSAIYLVSNGILVAAK